jgi:branched-chain amino acid transport system ATP-binding protein
MTLLEIEKLTVRYGPIGALRDVSLTVREHETVAIAGANGAGKSTLSLAVTGVIAPESGRICFAGDDITGLAPEVVANRKVALVPEGRHIFEGLTVLENLLIGARLRRGQVAASRDIEEIFDRFPILRERRSSLATRLSGGEQQQLAIGRALLSKPRLLILDEPSLGLSPVMVDRVYETLAALKKEGLTILLIEQNTARLSHIADRVYVFSNGAIKSSGTAEAILDARTLESDVLGGFGGVK